MSAVMDPRRLAALDRLDILDTMPEPGFDDIVHLASQLCGTPVSLVSLVAGDRQWFKARVSFPSCETDLNSSVCAHALVEPDLLVIPDLTVDPRTRENPLVTGEPHIRFYAGAPLRTAEGAVLGSLCAIDVKPRPEGLTEAQSDGLRRRARQVMSQLELRRVIRQRDAMMAERVAELRRERRLAALGDVSAALLTASDPVLVLAPLLEAEAAGLGFDQSYTYDVSPDGLHLRLTHAIGADDATRDFLREVALDVPLCGIVAESGESLVLGDLKAGVEPRHALARAGGLDAYAGYPITSHGRLRGVISFGSRTERAFDAEALGFFATVARFLSLARERLDREAALRASEGRLNLTFEAAGAVGWWDWDIPNDRLVASELFARLYSVDPAAAASGAPVAAYVEGIHPDDRAWVGDRVQHAIETAGVFSEEYRLKRSDGTVHWVYARGRCYHDAAGRPLRYPGVAIDITARKREALLDAALAELGDRLRDQTGRAEVIGAASEILGRALDLSHAGYGAVDHQLDVIDVAHGWCSPGLPPIDGRYRMRDYASFVDDLRAGETVLIEDVARDPRSSAAAGLTEATRTKTLANQPVMEQGHFVAVFFALKATPHAWAPEEVAFLRSVADRTRAAIGRIEAEDRQRLLNEELSHRLKNTLAMVQAIARQTLKSVAEHEAVDAFNQRLAALSRAHDILLQESWATARVRTVVEGTLALHAAPSRLSLQGPDINLGPRAVLSLTLLLHELATNANKYGSLSVAGGSVLLDWSVVDGVKPSFVMVWQERGGPPALAPVRKGFGSRLIRMGLAGTGNSVLSYNSEGLRAEFRAPLSLVTGA